MGTSSGAYELNHEYASTIYFRDKTPVHMSVLTRPYLSNVLYKCVFGKRMLTVCRLV